MGEAGARGKGEGMTDRYMVSMGNPALPWLLLSLAWLAFCLLIARPVGMRRREMLEIGARIWAFVMLLALAACVILGR